ncbi:MAG: hypothetical protein K0R15_656 [Clostridiales bacterium]|jgi:hypothetical protein|nr:hypothetical protein [Clostridiales bacterium]
MNKTIEKLQNVQDSMNNIYNDLATDQEKIKREIHQIEGKIEYITLSEHIPAEIKNRDINKLSLRLNVLMVKLMCEVEKGIIEMRYR